MGRQLYRSAHKFMADVLGNTNQDTDTPVTAIKAAVAQDETEVAPIEKTLSVMVAQGYLTQSGEGENAAYRLTAEGADIMSKLGGA